MVLPKLLRISAFFAGVLSAGYMVCLVQYAAGEEPAPKSDEYRFWVQVDAFSRKSHAVRRVEQLREKGYAVRTVNSASAAGRVLYKVLIGPYATRTDAVQTARVFRENEKHDCFVVQTAESDHFGMPHAAVTPPAGVADGLPTKKTLSTDTTRSAAGRPGGVVPSNVSTGVSREASGSVYFTIQVATFTRKEDADRLTDRLKRAGIAAYSITRAAEAQAASYKVRFGRYATRREAEQSAEAYSKSSGSSDFLIVASSLKVSGSATPETGDTEPAAGTSEPLQPLPETQVQPLRDEKLQPEIEWPDSITTIYAYRTATGALNLTNNYTNVPERYRMSIEYISIFPSRFLSVSPEGVLCFSMEGRDKKVRLAGVRFPDGDLSAHACAYCRNAIEDVPVRVKYCPGVVSDDGHLFVRVYVREGPFINYELVRQGLCSFVPDGLGSGQRGDFMEAQRLAKQEKAGMWSHENRHK